MWKQEVVDRNSPAYEQHCCSYPKQHAKMAVIGANANLRYLICSCKCPAP